MNKKYIWSIYIIGWMYFIFLDNSYSQDDHIFSYLIFGWIPFLVLHFLWNSNASETTSVQTTNNKKLDIHELVFDIVDKKNLLEILDQEDELQVAYKQVNQDLQAFSENVGLDLSDIEEYDDYMKLTPAQMKEFEKIKENRSKILSIQRFSTGYISLVEEINTKLLAGLPFNDAKRLYKSKLKVLHETMQKEEADIIISKILGEAIAEAKRKGKEEIDTEEINKRVDAEVKKLSKKAT